MRKVLLYLSLGVLFILLAAGTGCGKKEVKDQQPVSAPVQTAASAGETVQTPAGKIGSEAAQPPKEGAGNEPAAQTTATTSTSPAAPEPKQAETSAEKSGAPVSDSAPKQNEAPAEPATKPEPPAPKEEEKPVANQKSPFEEYLTGLPGRFVPENAAGVTASYQFNITDGHPGKYFVKIENGRCTVGKGAVNSPSITVNVGEQLWLDIARDKVNGTMAYLTGKFTADGNTDYLSNMKKYFKKLE